MSSNKRKIANKKRAAQQEKQAKRVVNGIFIALIGIAVLTLILTAFNS